MLICLRIKKQYAPIERRLGAPKRILLICGIFLRTFARNTDDMDDCYPRLLISVKDQVTWRCTRRFPTGDRRRSSVFIALWSPQQRRNPPACGKNRLRLKDQLLGRAHLARHSINVEKIKLWARLRTRKVTGRDASLPAPLLETFAYWSPAERLGRCPKPHQRRCLWTPQGALPLDPFFVARLERVILAFGDKRLFCP